MRRESKDFKNWADSSRMVVDSTPVNLTPIQEESFAIAASSNGGDQREVVTVTYSD